MQRLNVLVVVCSALVFVFPLNAVRTPVAVAQGQGEGVGNEGRRLFEEETVVPVLRATAKQQEPFLQPTPGRVLPSTLLDGRQPNLSSQAAEAIHDHAQATIVPTTEQLSLIARFQLTDRFFSSTALRNFANGAL